jgi:hypothetical protein
VVRAELTMPAIVVYGVVNGYPSAPPSTAGPEVYRMNNRHDLVPFEKLQGQANCLGLIRATTPSVGRIDRISTE